MTTALTHMQTVTMAAIHDPIGRAVASLAARASTTDPTAASSKATGATHHLVGRGMATTAVGRHGGRGLKIAVFFLTRRVIVDPIGF
jgi:hypothetical protein